MSYKIEREEENDSDDMDEDIDSSCFTHVSFDSSGDTQNMYIFGNPKNASSTSIQSFDSYSLIDNDDNECSG
ncbi:hypothetical protein DPMN_049222 [Dreissena polymorpha]|uniref:Uncharacterized protein n=3 Tax=Dreissena polymorpha TaxID=45954 RepID=A0A9D4CEZ4_DREPO|nr:hypothetical protein DPMN_049222 [Dreissena polymorpha]